VDVKLEQPNSAINDFLKAHGLTVSSLLHVAWGLLLKSYTGSDDVCFGYLISGRDAPIPGIENAVGLFANLLPCRINFTSGDSLFSLLQDSQTDLARAFSHQHTSLAKVLGSLKLNGQILFNTVISIQNRAVRDQQEGTGLSGGGLMVEELDEMDPTEVSTEPPSFTSQPVMHAKRTMRQKLMEHVPSISCV
jgi:non-ribosomal peptide synthetase component F